jgi:alpha-1,3-mannosyltransferase
MKVLHITPTFYPAVGGIETVIRELVRNLRRRGFEADVMQVSPGNKQTKEFLDGSTVWRVPLIPNRLVGLIPPIRSILVQYDVLHVHDPQVMALSANVLWQGRGKYKVLSTHGGYFHTSKYSLMKNIHWNAIAPIMLRQYDEILASSQSDWERFKTKAPTVKLIPNGVNVEKFQSIGRGPNPESTRWLYWGRLSRNKRIDMLIETVAQVRDAGVRIDLLIAGEDFDGLAKSFETQIERLKLSDAIRILGPLSEIELMSEIGNRSVFISASEHEGFGLSIVEAMAAGMIVICRDMAPLNGFIKSGENGVLLNFDGGDSDLRSLVELCTSSNDALHNMQESARIAAGMHSWDLAISRYVQIYEQFAPEALRLKHDSAILHK